MDSSLAGVNAALTTDRDCRCACLHGGRGALRNDRLGRNADVDPRAGAEARAHAEDAAEMRHALAHADQTESSGCGWSPEILVRVEPLAVIADLEHHRVLVEPHAHDHPACSRMLEDVAQ